MSTVGKFFSYTGWGLGSMALYKNGDAIYSIPAYSVLGVALILSVMIVVVIYRVTAKTDLVELIKAWRNNLPQKRED